MSHRDLVLMLGELEPVACALVLAFMAYRRQIARYGFLSAFIAARMISDVALLLLYRAVMSNWVHSGGNPFYDAYFYTYWSSYALEALLGFGVIYNIFHLAMAPLEGLRSLGIVMFKWAFGIAGAISLSVGLSSHSSASTFLVRALGQLQQAESVLTLCMLLFVCMAIRPMGLSHTSKIFGVSLGLGILAACDLAVSAFGTSNLESSFEVIRGLATFAALTTWIIYFALPEPKRRMVLLPTTSPFLRWNQIAQVLNDAPGFVAIGEVTPEMFAPAELEIMRRASAKMEPTALAVNA